MAVRALDKLFESRQNKRFSLARFLYYYALSMCSTSCLVKLCGIFSCKNY